MLPLGEFAFQFVKRAVSCEFTFVICDLILNEVASHLKTDKERVLALIFSELTKKQKLQIIDYSDELVLAAKKLARERALPLNDCIFALIAKEEGLIVVSRDKHFEQLSDIVFCFKPEDL